MQYIYLFIFFFPTGYDEDYSSSDFHSSERKQRTTGFSREENRNSSTEDDSIFEKRTANIINLLPKDKNSSTNDFKEPQRKSPLYDYFKGPDRNSSLNDFNFHSVMEKDRKVINLFKEPPMNFSREHGKNSTGDKNYYPHPKDATIISFIRDIDDGSLTMREKVNLMHFLRKHAANNSQNQRTLKQGPKLWNITVTPKSNLLEYKNKIEMNKLRLQKFLYDMRKQREGDQKVPVINVQKVFEKQRRARYEAQRTSTKRFSFKNTRNKKGYQPDYQKFHRTANLTVHFTKSLEDQVHNVIGQVLLKSILNNTALLYQRTLMRPYAIYRTTYNRSLIASPDPKLGNRTTASLVARLKAIEEQLKFVRQSLTQSTTESR